MNNEYRITVSAPLLRPGLVIETTCSEKYLAPVVAQIMQTVRHINSSATKPTPDAGGK